jgi:ribosomal protein S18 acetylase RimI-like enzyme
VISIRRARPADAAAIGAVHVAAWRSAYPGLLPDNFLASMSAARHAAQYDRAIRNGLSVHVAAVSGLDLLGAGGPPGGKRSRSDVAGLRGMGDDEAGDAPMAGPRIVGFATSEKASAHAPAEGEIETLYVLDDWRERGIGRRLLRAAAAGLRNAGCRSAFLWVLRDNPSRWFYQHLGGRPAAEATIQFGGVPLVQTAFVWDPIERLLQSSPQAS